MYVCMYVYVCVCMCAALETECKAAQCCLNCEALCHAVNLEYSPNTYTHTPPVYCPSICTVCVHIYICVCVCLLGTAHPPPQAPH